MNEEQELVWARLKQRNVLTTVVTFTGSGAAHKFNSAWLSDFRTGNIRITVDDVAQSLFRDYSIHFNDIIFHKVIPRGHKVNVEVYM